MNFNLPSLMQHVFKGWSIWETHSLHNPDPGFIDVLFSLPVSACILFSSYPCLSFFVKVSLGCHQSSAAGTHT